jgi:hypothetical protein
MGLSSVHRLHLVPSVAAFWPNRLNEGLLLFYRSLVVRQLAIGRYNTSWTVCLESDLIMTLEGSRLMALIQARPRSAVKLSHGPHVQFVAVFVSPSRGAQVPRRSVVCLVIVPWRSR